MVRWLTTCVVIVLLLPLGAEAQQLKVLASGTSLQVKAENSSSYIEVTGADGQGNPLYTVNCQPNVICGGFPPGASSTSSRLVYANARERLTNCNGVAPTSDGAECSRADGILTATLQVRTGKLKISAKPASGYSGLLLNTTGKSVRLEFAESNQDSWSFGYSSSNFGQAAQWQTVPAGSYRVFAADLSAHCDPTQTNTGAELTVPEGSTAEDGLEFIALFRAQSCEVKVVRSASGDAGLGEVVSEPAGLDCPAGSAACTGSFAFGTDVKLTPVGSYAWDVADGCQPTNAPCTKRIASDRSFTLSFSPGSPSVQDAGAGVDTGSPSDDEDASAADADTAARDDAGAGSEREEDAVAGSGDASSNSAEDGDQPPQEDTEEPQGVDAGGLDEEEAEGGASKCSAAPAGHADVSSALLALGALAGLWVRRRQSRLR